ncbi:hypothetical protein [Magnetovibrio sp.]|uniref:hypothetical protein n=1 Tax=Magnetovibrio sp. TaxID=2024836 RepID=UPI002F956CCA
MTSSEKIDKTAKALIEHHGAEGAQDYCEDRVLYHDKSKEIDAANLWRAIGKAVNARIEAASDSD